MKLGVRSKLFLISLLLLSVMGLTTFFYVDAHLDSIRGLLAEEDYRVVSDHLMQLFFVAGLLGLAVSLIISLVTSHFVARIIQDLLETAKGMLKGQIPQSEISRRKDELGSIARTLGQVAEEFETLLDTLTHERDQFRAVLQGMDLGVIGLDADMRIGLVNRSAKTLLGIEDNPMDKPLVDVIRTPPLVRLVRGDLDAEEREVEFQTGSTPQKTLLARLTPQRISGGNILVIQDITALRRLESARQDFVANVSHELRTPVSIIRGAAENLEEGAMDEPVMARRFLESILRNSNRLSLLISDLLELSRLDSGTTTLEALPIGLQSVADAVIESLSDRILAKNVEVMVDIDPEHHIIGDPMGIEQILTNLIDNALKYGASPGRIDVSSRPTETGILVSVEDDGPGVAPSHRTRVFERFFRVDPGRARKDGGTGLGLAIVKHLVLSMNGTIWLEESTRGGCRFCFELTRPDNSEIEIEP